MEENIKELRKENKKKFYIGQNVWFKESFTRRFEDTIDIKVVEKIGVKFVTMTDGETIDLEDMSWVRKDYGIQGSIYFSEKEWKDEMQNKLNLQVIGKYIKYNCRCTLAQSTAILAILNSDEESGNVE